MLHILEDSTVNAISENKRTLYSFKRSCHLQAMICLLVLIYIKSSQLRYMYLLFIPLFYSSPDQTSQHGSHFFRPNVERIVTL